LLPVHDNPDPALIRRTRRNDRDAFLILVRRYAHCARALVEARIPGSSEVDEHTALAFARIHKTLFVVHELDWFHLFVMRTTSAHLDASGLAPTEPGPAAPEWLTRLSLAQREALLFVEHADPPAPFPTIEFLGISAETLEARLQRAADVRARCSEQGGGELPPGPAPDFADRLCARVDELLGPRRKVVARRRFPEMPLPLSFALAVGIAALLVAILFQRPTDARRQTVFEPTRLTGERELVRGVSIEVAKDTLATRIGYKRVRLDRGEVVIHDAGNAPVEVEIGDRMFRSGHGRFRLSSRNGTYTVEALEGRGSLRRADETADTRDLVWVDGKESWQQH